MKNSTNIAIIAAAAISFQAYSMTNKAGSNKIDAPLWKGNFSTSVSMCAGGLKGKTVKQQDDAQQFIQQAAISGMSEVQLSQLALKKTKNSSVKNFAAMMVKDHSGANAELKTLAKAKGYSLPDSSSLSQPDNFTTATGSAGSTAGNTSATTGTTSNGTGSNGTGAGSSGTTGNDANSGNQPGDMTLSEKMDRLSSASNKDFDQQYLQLMIRDHIKAVSLFEMGTKSSDPQVKAYAVKYLPALKMHLKQVTAISKTVIGQSSGN